MTYGWVNGWNCFTLIGIYLIPILVLEKKELKWVCRGGKSTKCNFLIERCFGFFVRVLKIKAPFVGLWINLHSHSIDVPLNVLLSFDFKTSSDFFASWMSVPKPINTKFSTHFGSLYCISQTNWESWRWANTCSGSLPPQGGVLDSVSCPNIQVQLFLKQLCFSAQGCGVPSASRPILLWACFW